MKYVVTISLIFFILIQFANLLQETNEQQSASKATKWEASRSFSGNRRNTRGRGKHYRLEEDLNNTILIINTILIEGTRRKKKGNLGSYDNIKTRNYSTNRVSGRLDHIVTISEVINQTVNSYII